MKEFKKYTFKQLDQFTATEDKCRPATQEQRDCFMFNSVLTVEIGKNVEARLDTNVSVNFIIAHNMITQIVVKNVDIHRVSMAKKRLPIWTNTIYPFRVTYKVLLIQQLSLRIKHALIQLSSTLRMSS